LRRRRVPLTPAARLAKALLGRGADARVMREADLQALIIGPYLDLCVAAGVLVTWWHVPNGGSRNKAEAARLKRMGVRAGVPDLTLVFAGTETRPLVAMVELKVGRNRPEAAQRTMLEALCRAGVCADVARSLEELRDILCACLVRWSRPDLLARLPGVV